MKTVILGLCFFTIGMVVFSFGIDSLMTGNQATSWPTTEGTNISSKCAYYFELDGLLNSTYFTHVKYSYAVAGKSYNGDRVAFGYTGSWWRGPNQKIAERLSSARTVVVRYDPDKPSRAVLSCGLNGSIVRTLFIGSWIMLVTAVSVRYALRSQHKTGMLSLSWGSSQFRIMIQGVGGIVLLVVIGWVIAALAGLFCDWGILGTMVTT